MIVSIIGWIVFGLVVGLLARLLHPGKDAMGIVPTILLGVTGSLIGGGFWYLLQGGSDPYSPGGFLAALIFSVILLAFGVFANDSRAKSRTRV